jgi:hypothetical protein
MVKIHTWYKLAIGFAMMSASTWAFAQQVRRPIDSGVPDKATIAKMPPAERLDQGQKMVNGMKASLKGVEQALDTARNRDRDIRKINCINEKLVSVKGYVKISEKSYIDLKDANERQDSEASVHHFTLIAISDQKVEQLSDAARLCVGDVSKIDGSNRTVTVDPDIAPYQAVGEGGRIAIEPLNPLDGLEDFDRLPELTPFQ